MIKKKRTVARKSASQEMLNKFLQRREMAWIENLGQHEEEKVSEKGSVEKGR